MPSYKLQYFNVRGRAELTRYLFAAADKGFEDIRFTHDEWSSKKASAPFGQLPVLDVDGKQLAQSNSIVRFLAREFGLAGKDSWEQALVDQYVELAEDFFMEYVKVFFEKDEAKKAELQKNLNDVVYPKYLGLLEEALNNNGGKYFVGKEMTAADLAILNVFDTPLSRCETLMDEFPKMKAHRAAIAGTSNIAKYLETREKTDI